MSKSLTPVMEDYLETIALLDKKKGVVRVKDIGEALEVKNPTVNSALKTLSEKGLVKHQKYGYVNITPAGSKAAQAIQDKHNLIFKFLTSILDIDQKEASQDACRIEHAISPETFNRLAQFIRFVETGLNQGNPQWLKSFKHYLKTGKKLNCPAQSLALKRRGKRK